MKRFSIFVACLLIFVSCGISKKVVTDTHESSVDSTSTTILQESTTNKVVDTTKTDHGKVIITEIDFFEPVAPQPPVVSDGDSAPPPAPASPQVTIDNVGTFSGVKHVKQTVIDTQTTQMGKSSELTETRDSTANAAIVKRESDEHTESEPVPDPHRWRYISYLATLLVLVALAIFIYVKRHSVLRWFRKIFTFL